MIQAGSNTLPREIHKLVNCDQNKEQFSQQWMEPIIVPIY